MEVVVWIIRIPPYLQIRNLPNLKIILKLRKSINAQVTKNCLLVTLMDRIGEKMEKSDPEGEELLFELEFGLG